MTAAGSGATKKGIEYRAGVVGWASAPCPSPGAGAGGTVTRCRVDLRWSGRVMTCHQRYCVPLASRRPARTVAPAHEQVAHIHDEGVLPRRGVDEVAGPTRVLGLQAPAGAVLLEQQGDGAPVRVRGHAGDGPARQPRRLDGRVVQQA